MSEESRFGSEDIELCRRNNHRLKTAWSNKNPMKVHLICETCSARNPGKTVFVAYGVAEGSFGAWYRRAYKERKGDEPGELLEDVEE